MLNLRKGKKILKQYKTAYDFAEDFEILDFITNGNDAQAEQIAKAVCKNAFGLCMTGAKINLGGGYVFENK